MVMICNPKKMNLKCRGIFLICKTSVMMLVDSFPRNGFICHGQIGLTIKDRKLLMAEWGNISQENKITLLENLI